MAQPASRTGLRDYCLRQLGFPVLEINIDDDQVDDAIDDALQYYRERHYDGVERMYLKHVFTAADAEKFTGSDKVVSLPGDDGLVTFIVTNGGSNYADATAVATSTSGSGTGLTLNISTTNGAITKILIDSDGQDYEIGDTITVSGGSNDATIEVRAVKRDTEWENRNNYLEIPDHIIGISKVYGISSNFVRNNMFGMSNQYYLMDLFSNASGTGLAFGGFDMVNYYMIKQHFENIDMIVNTGSLISYRFNCRQDRLYLDVDPKRITKDHWLLIDCFRALDPETFTQVYNDPFIKKYTTALIKRQWGQNLIKFNGIQLPGGVSINGRELYTDAEKEIAALMEKSSRTFELPPMDMIG
jgi:hypothetical protein